ncbi:MAG: glycosyl transferase [Phycisphaera sp.]|nr:glycosyl transferase [Phycisphaera sp.]
MTTSRQAEHFVTLFDRAFLPVGLALHASLVRHAGPFRLWVIGMDDAVCEALTKLDLPGVTVVPLREVENDFPGLMGAKSTRSFGEYCWTLGAFSFDVVFRRCADARRVTYLDADVFFFADPRELIEELDTQERHVLITAHHYAPEYDLSATSGKYCVQFVTFDRSEVADTIRRKWQGQNLEKCGSDHDGQTFGDQMYLDAWPTDYPGVVHVAQQADRLLAPWNVSHLCEKHGDRLDPLMFHYHGLRILSRDRVRLYVGYRVNPSAMRFFREYLDALAESVVAMGRVGLDLKPMPTQRESLGTFRRARRVMLGLERFASLPT